MRRKSNNKWYYFQKLNYQIESIKELDKIRHIFW